jgi:hypothetical protein
MHVCQSLALNELSDRILVIIFACLLRLSISTLNTHFLDHNASSCSMQTDGVAVCVDDEYSNPSGGSDAGLIPTLRVPGRKRRVTVKANIKGQDVTMGVGRTSTAKVEHHFDLKILEAHVQQIMQCKRRNCVWSKDAKVRSEISCAWLAEHKGPAFAGTNRAATFLLVKLLSETAWNDDLQWTELKLAGKKVCLDCYSIVQGCSRSWLCKLLKDIRDTHGVAKRGTSSNTDAHTSGHEGASF